MYVFIYIWSHFQIEDGIILLLFINSILEYSIVKFFQTNTINNLIIMLSWLS